MVRAVYISVGLLATGLAILGAILPGLPTVPFLIVALWAFARSSDTLYSALERIPLLRSALMEAHRFEHRGTIRAGVKVVALATAWTSAALTFAAGTRPAIVATVVAAALGATFTMWWFPTERD
jgi:uncharacterized membrane protein YbaN (DUF454 family)